MSRMSMLMWIGVATALALPAAADDTEELKKAVASAKINMNQAIEAAAREVPSGKVVEAELDMENGVARYEVEILVGDAWKEVFIDAATGKVMKVAETIDKDRGDNDDAAEARKAVSAATVTFAQTLEKCASEHGGTTPVKIELEFAGNKAVYRLQLLEGEKIRRVSYDAATATPIR